jgi:hypothetical protein
LAIPEDAAAAEASSAFEISMMNLWSFFGNEKPWVLLANPRGAASELEAQDMSGFITAGLGPVCFSPFHGIANYDIAEGHNSGD